MGICKQKFNFRFGAETVRKLLEIQDAFHPWCPTLTSTVERTIDFWHLVVTSEGTLEEVWRVLQSKHGKASWYTNFAERSAQTAKPGPHKLPSLGEAGERRPGTLLFRASKLANAGSDFLRVHRSWSITPFGLARDTQLRSIRLDSYSFRERVA